ncbi:MAG: hypothetical protein AAB933_02140 [Patescibacteria group bacterium]
MKGEAKTKKMTLDKLAIMVANGFESVEKKMATKDDIKDMATKTDIEGLKSQIQGVNNRIDDISMNRVKYEDHNKLKVRVDFIEKKLEIKK